MWAGTMLPPGREPPLRNSSGVTTWWPIIRRYSSTETLPPMSVRCPHCGTGPGSSDTAHLLQVVGQGREVEALEAAGPGEPLLGQDHDPLVVVGLVPAGGERLRQRPGDAQ